MRHRRRMSEKDNNHYQADRPCGRILIALRAGPMDKEQISARFTWEVINFPRVLKDGFVEMSSGYYRLTEAGKKACPSRRGMRI